MTYLETGSEADREESFQYSAEVLSEIQKIRSNGTIYEPWRFELLERMAENLSQKREDVLEVYNPVDRALSNLDVYNEYIHSEELFQDSSSNYYRFLTQSMERMQEQITRLQNLAIGSVVFVCLGMLAIAIWYHMFNQRYIAKPLTEVLEGIDQIHQEDMNVSIDEMNSQEMERLRQSLLEMAATHRENYEMEKSNYELQKQLTQSELKMMQEQINPHFLFNTLNTIYCLAEEEHATDAANMLLKTSRLLQYGLKKRNQLSTVAAEVQALQDYVEIQQIRFVGKIEFNIMVDDLEEYGDQPFPAMILQPLVENSLKHGLKNCTSKGYIEVHVWGDESFVSLSVLDNGDGMDPEVLEDLLAEDFHNAGDSLGLQNVITRLRLLFGDRVEFDMRSMPKPAWILRF